VAPGESGARRENYIRGWVTVWSWKLHSEISLMPHVVYIGEGGGGKKIRNLFSIFDLNRVWGAVVSKRSNIVPSVSIKTPTVVLFSIFPRKNEQICTKKFSKCSWINSDFSYVQITELRNKYSLVSVTQF